MNCKCGKPVEWTDWNYFTVRGYRTRENKCSCKIPQFQSEPVTKDKRLFWEAVRPETEKK